MIPYIEIIDRYSLKKVTQIEPSECWFELSYYEVGECEIYAPATLNNLRKLTKGCFVKIPNKKYIWFITSLEYNFTSGGAKMIIAKGYEAKWLLNKRIIQKPIELQGNITTAIYNLVNNNLGLAAETNRKINGFTVDTTNLLIDITGTQATRGNLGDFVNILLKTYNCGSCVIYENEKLVYKIINGSVKTQQVRFSQSFDNLLSSKFYTNDEDLKTNVLAISNVDDIEYSSTYDKGATGIDRGEILVDSNLSTKYVDTNGQEKELDLTNSNDLSIYKGWQVEEGKNELANNTTVEEFNGEIDLEKSMYEFDVDFSLGDLVKVQDEYFNFSRNTRILKYTFSQSSVYTEIADYGE